MYPELANATDQVNQASDDEDEAEAAIGDFEQIKRVVHEDIMKRPARKQIKDMRNETAYIEGNYDYNIWYDKFLTDQRIEEERVTSMHKLDPIEDPGYTKADKFDKAGYFCTYFARGCCSEGVNCRFYHRVPQPSDLRDDEIVKDWFGRTKHSKFKEDFTGIGTFSEDCKTLKITDIAIPDRSKPVRELLRIFYEAFAPWGDLVDIHLNVSKWVGFVKYSHRFYAEFAREAMYDQAIFGGTDPITLRWAPSSPFEKKEQEMEAHFIGEMNDLKERQKMMSEHAKRAVKDLNKKTGYKRKREESKFDQNLVDSKRAKQAEEEDPNAPVDNKEIADNLSKLSSIFQRMEKANQ